MQYHNILFPHGRPAERVSEELLYDLRIDSVLLKLSNGPDQLKYDTCYLPLRDKESVLYRHAIFQDIMKGELFQAFMDFQGMMNEVFFLEEKMNRVKLPVMRCRFLLDQILYYVRTTAEFLEALKKTTLSSEGLKLFRKDLGEYLQGEDFCSLCREAEELEQELSEITYQIHVEENHITVKPFRMKSDDWEGVSDFENELDTFFGQFIHGKAEFPQRMSESWDLNPVEEQILECLLQLFPEPFHRLERLKKERLHFIPEGLDEYHKDLGFYTVWLEYIIPKQAQNLNFCFPMIVNRSEGFMAANCFDLILADQMLKDSCQVIRNNLILDPEEHILVLTGPNQGGKTTFARMLGQLFYLGALGVPVPGTMVKMFLPDHIFTHFERQEVQSSRNGKLKDDIVRIHEIMGKASDESLILINEMFASTTLSDASWLGKRILDQIHELGAFCLYVTFINELASYLPDTVSLVSEIGDDQEERTYQITRGKADGKAYARSMVKKYSLTYEAITERMGADS